MVTLLLPKKVYDRVKRIRIRKANMNKISNCNIFEIKNKLAEYTDHRYYGLEVSFHIGQGFKLNVRRKTLICNYLDWTLFSEPWKRKTNYPHTSDWYIIDEGARALERWTCLRFVEHTNEHDYVGNALNFVSLSPLPCRIAILNDT